MLDACQLETEKFFLCFFHSSMRYYLSEKSKSSLCRGGGLNNEFSRSFFSKADRHSDHSKSCFERHMKYYLPLLSIKIILNSLVVV